ncbi:MAG TPA: hypothetical protein VMU50_11680 [Polyangia bacterium]|nr:hypothetical protein [Polyangia bacterium]
MTMTTGDGAMAETQQATPPPWLGRSRWALLLDIAGGWRQARDRVAQLVSFFTTLFWPRRVRRRLERLRGLRHIDQLPTTAQLLVAARDQMVLGAAVETKIFYQSQGIPWVFHNLRRFLSNPATMIDPTGLFSHRDAIIHHVLQTFHRHPVYDLVLLRAFPDGVDQMVRQTEQILAGTHPHQRALTSLIEAGNYYPRLLRDVTAFRDDPHVATLAIPVNLVRDPRLMLAMDQFKDLRGYTNYAARLRVGPGDAARAWLTTAFNVTLGALLRLRLGPSHIDVGACDDDLRARHIAPAPAPV